MHGCRSPVPNAAFCSFLTECPFAFESENLNHGSVELGTTSLLAVSLQTRERASGLSECDREPARIHSRNRYGVRGKVPPAIASVHGEGGYKSNTIRGSRCVRVCGTRRAAHELKVGSSDASGIRSQSPFDTRGTDQRVGEGCAYGSSKRFDHHRWKLGRG